MALNTAASILARLKIKARTSGTSYQQQLQLFCQEGFLRRLYASKYRERFILKGGLLLYIESGFSGRPTMDIDFLLRGMPNTLDKVEEAIREITYMENGNDHIDFHFFGVEQITEDKQYMGVRVKLRAQLSNVKIPLQLDLGVGDVIVPKIVEKPMPTQLDGYDQPKLLVYPLESVIAEKFEAIVSLMEANSRMKDYYDIYYLACKKTFC